MDVWTRPCVSLARAPTGRARKESGSAKLAGFVRQRSAMDSSQKRQLSFYPFIHLAQFIGDKATPPRGILRASGGMIRLE